MSKELYRKSVGRRIRRVRLEHKLNMEKFAELINEYSGVVKPTKSNVSRWERGENIPNDLTLKAIAEIGNTTVDYLLNENPLSDYSTEELQAEIDRRKSPHGNAD